MIPQFKVFMPKTVDDELLRVLHSGFIGQGEKVNQFEKDLGDYFGNKNVLTINSGTGALQLALRLANVSYGDEVISTPMTCTATNMPILAAGAKIVWCDVDPVTGLADPDSIESKITKKTKAIMLVHFGGIPCDIKKVNKIAKKHNIKVIEDGAHALGSSYMNQKIGCHSDFVMFSLQAIKHITTVDGGLLLTKNDDDYARGKLLRWYGIDRETKSQAFRCEDDILEYGYKLHMNDICATIGIEQLKYVDEIVGKHMANKDFYDKALSGIDGIDLIPSQVKEGSSSWLYTLHIKNRDSFMRWMMDNEIQVSRVHERNDKHTAFKDSAVTLKNLDIFNSTQVSIPVGWWLSEANREIIVSKIKEFAQMNFIYE